MAASLRALAFGVAALSGVSRAAVRTLAERQAVDECSSERSGLMFTLGQITGLLPSEVTLRAEPEVENADLFEIKYGANFKVLLERHAREMYVLTQCGTERPSEMEVNAVQRLPAGYTLKHFTVPLQVV